ncbi:MAG: hypothetical protein ACFFA0_04520 [Promethearchaeota archaeon]
MQDTFVKNNNINEIDKEEENHSVWLEHKSFRIALVSIFSALALVIGYLLANILNIELFTLTIFLSGFILGKRDGMIVGFLSSSIFCFFNPYGASPLPLYAVQLTHYTLTGLLGAVTNQFLNKRNLLKADNDLYIRPVLIILGSIGAIITINFQFFASLADFLSYYGTFEQFLPYFVSGIPFAITHIIGNTLGFIFILPGLIQLIQKMLLF